MRRHSTTLPAVPNHPCYPLLHSPYKLRLQSCKLGFTLNMETQQCEPVACKVAGCLSCEDDPARCDPEFGCSDGKFYDETNNACSPCPEGCATCSKWGCGRCARGYWMEEAKRLCNKVSIRDGSHGCCTAYVSCRCSRRPRVCGVQFEAGVQAQALTACLATCAPLLLPCSAPWATGTRPAERSGVAVPTKLGSVAMGGTPLILFARVSKRREKGWAASRPFEYCSLRFGPTIPFPCDACDIPLSLPPTTASLYTC